MKWIHRLGPDPIGLRSLQKEIRTDTPRGTTSENSPLQVQERSLLGNPPCQHLDLGIPASDCKKKEFLPPRPPVVLKAAKEHTYFTPGFEGPSWSASHHINKSKLRNILLVSA